MSVGRLEVGTTLLSKFEYTQNLLSQKVASALTF
jgi:hypothetical protein